jgi:hypothetical protein
MAQDGFAWLAGVDERWLAALPGLLLPAGFRCRP